MSSRTAIVLAFLLVYVVWGSTYLGIRFVVDAVPPLLAMGARFGVAGLLLYGWSRARGVRAPTRRQWRTAAVLGGLWFLCGNGAVAWSEAHGLPTSTAALLVATMPLWLTMLERLTGRRPSLRAWVGLGVGFIGTALLLDPETSATPLVPALVVCAGALAWAGGSLLARRLDAAPDDRLAASMAMITGGVWLLGLGVVTGEQLPAASAITPSAVAAFLYLVFAGSIAAFTAFGWLLRRVEPSKLATYAYVNPVVAVLLGALVGEPITLTSMGAMLLVLLGVASTIAANQPATPSTRAPRPWLSRRLHRRPAET